MLSKKHGYDATNGNTGAGADGFYRPTKLMPGTGCCSLPDSIALTKHAVGLGCPGVLMLPPFYYKATSDEGLFRYFANVIERVGDERLRIYLYHIPPISQVPISLNLIEKLISEFPGIVVGIKDSSGDWEHTRQVIDRFAPAGFRVFPGSEKLAGTGGGGASAGN